MGIVSPVGRGVDLFWDAVCRGVSGIRPITRFPVADFAYTRGGELRDFVYPRALSHKPQPLDLATQFMMAAALEAMNSAGLADGTVPRDDAGVIVSTNFGGAVAGEDFLATLSGGAEDHAESFSAFAFQNCADLLADAWRLGGPRPVDFPLLQFRHGRPGVRRRTDSQRPRQDRAHRRV